MTAEIAVLSKSAVVLAADSAVTIGQGGSAKIFNSANKIFEVSENSPIGLMVFNRLDFMDLPLEVLAKEYRRSRRARTFRTVKECHDDFLTYLGNEVECSDHDKRHNLATISYGVIQRLADLLRQELTNKFFRGERVLPSKMNGLLKEVAEKERARIKGLPKAAGFTKINLTADDKVDVDGVLKHSIHWFDVTQTAKSSVYDVVRLTIERTEVSGIFTGLVFAGFGGDEICPTLIHSDMDGVLKNRIKCVERKTVDIGRSGPAADVLGFAQDDMVQSFVNGVDPLYRSYEATLIRESVEMGARLILSQFLSDPAQADSAIAALAPSFDQARDALVARTDGWIEQNFSSGVKDMVRSMPKEDLATLAESLIEITSLKRKVTRERETVGGDVDVAVISKAEGLIWVKRKHYFPPELNDRFFRRRER